MHGGLVFGVIVILLLLILFSLDNWGIEDYHTQQSDVLLGLSSGKLVDGVGEIKYSTLVFSGCGLLGCAYVGVLVELVKDWSFDKFCGSSSGGFFAAACACAGERVVDYLSSVDWRIGNWFGDRGNLRRNCEQMLKTLTGDSGITFSELFAKTGNVLVLTGSRFLGFGFQTHYFSPDDTPDMPIVDALYITATVPFLLQAKSLYDGGLANNFPISYFVDRDRVESILGCTVVSTQVGFAKKYLYNCLTRMSRENRKLADVVRTLHDQKQLSIIAIPVDYTSTDILSEDQISTLVETASQIVRDRRVMR